MLRVVHLVSGFHPDILVTSDPWLWSRDRPSSQTTRQNRCQQLHDDCCRRDASLGHTEMYAQHCDLHFLETKVINEYRQRTTFSDRAYTTVGYRRIVLLTSRNLSGSVSRCTENLTCDRVRLQGYSLTPGEGRHFVQIARNCRALVQRVQMNTPGERTIVTHRTNLGIYNGRPTSATSRR